MIGRAASPGIMGIGITKKGQWSSAERKRQPLASSKTNEKPNDANYYGSIRNLFQLAEFVQDFAHHVERRRLKDQRQPPEHRQLRIAAAVLHSP